MGYVFDASTLIDLVRGDEAVVARAADIDMSGATKLLATPVLFEIMTGLLFTQSRTEANRWRRALSSFQLLPFDEHAARAAAEIQAELMRAGRRSSDTDVMIAGIAAANGHVLVTQDKNLAAIDIPIGLDVETY